MRRRSGAWLAGLVLLAGCGSPQAAGDGGAAGGGGPDRVAEEVRCGPGRAELSAERGTSDRGGQVVVRLRLTGLEPGTEVIADITQDESPLDEGTVTADDDGAATLSGPLLRARPALVASSVVPTRSGGPECRLQLDTAPLR